MTGLRSSLRDHRILALLLLAACLALRIGLPAGTMLSGTSDGISVALCDGIGNSSVTLPGKREAVPVHADHASPCPYAVLALALLGGAAAPLPTLEPLAARKPALAGVVTWHLPIDHRWRPPLRAPPGLA